MRMDWLICGALGVNTYLIGAEETNERVVIDPGAAEPVLEALEKESLVCTHILLTHGHIDHIGGVAALKKQTGAQVCIHMEDSLMLGSNRLSLAVLTGDRLEPATADVLIKDGDIIQAAGLRIRVLDTPGHTRGGVSYALDAERKLFCGDTLFRDSVGRTDFPGGSYEALYRSIENKLFALDSEYEVYCGHGESTTLSSERRHNPFYLQWKKNQ